MQNTSVKHLYIVGSLFRYYILMVSSKATFEWQSMFQCRDNHFLKGATFKEKIMLETISKKGLLLKERLYFLNNLPALGI